MAKSNSNANIRNSSHSDKDVGAEFVSEWAQPVDHKVEREVVRKFDMILMPFMWVGFGLVCCDRVSDETVKTS